MRLLIDEEIASEIEHESGFLALCATWDLKHSRNIITRFLYMEMVDISIFPRLAEFANVYGGEIVSKCF